MATGTTETTGNPSASKATLLLGYTLLSLVLLSAVVVTFVAASRIPSPPLVAPTAVSVTVRNASKDRITADFDVTFLVLNDADKAMAFDHLKMSVSTFKFKAELGPLAPFELRSGENKTVSFRVDDVSANGTRLGDSD